MGCKPYFDWDDGMYGIAGIMDIDWDDGIMDKGIPGRCFCNTIFYDQAYSGRYNKDRNRRNR
jgi:hypothetical protein